MATALQFIKSAFSIAGEKADETDIEASELNSALELFNDMMVEWELKGANLGFAPVKDAGDEVRIPRGAYMAVKTNLAAYICMAFDIQFPAGLAEAANASKQSIMAIYKKPLRTVYPSTLPTGSGNDCGVYFNDRFFSGSGDENF